MSPRCIASYGFLALAWIGVAACSSVDVRTEPAEDNGTISANRNPPLDTSAKHWLNWLYALNVAEPDTQCAAYDPGDYPYPPKLEYWQVLNYGGVYDPYNDHWYATLDSLVTLDIEHIIARKEAHISGLCRMSVSQRQAFAIDSLNLALTHASTNRSKSDRDAAKWMPASNKCWFAHRIVQLREKYQLDIDRAERDTLAHHLLACASLKLKQDPERPKTPLEDYGPACPDEPYTQCAALLEDYPHGAYKAHCAYNPKLDRNQDGWICLGG